MKECDIRPELDTNSSHSTFLQNYNLEPDPLKPLGSMVSSAFDALRRDPCFEQVMERSDEYYYMESGR